jgi:hypothetical protein
MKLKLLKKKNIYQRKRYKENKRAQQRRIPSKISNLQFQAKGAEFITKPIAEMEIFFLQKLSWERNLY